MRSFADIFRTAKPIIGVIHLKGDGDGDVRARAEREIGLYLDGGLDAIIVEDYFGTYPQLEWCLNYLSRSDFGLPYGVNCLNFDSLCFGLAERYGCDFLQLDSVVGHVKPRDEKSLDAFFEIERPKCGALVMGGVRFKYQPVLSANTLDQDLFIAKTRCDAVCVTGDGTGIEAPVEKIGHFKSVLGDFPLVICSGVNDVNCMEQLRIADAAVVGSFFKSTGKDTGEVDANRISLLMSRVRELRSDLERVREM